MDKKIKGARGALRNSCDLYLEYQVEKVTMT
jgi:hypothetical protein